MLLNWTASLLAIAIRVLLSVGSGRCNMWDFFGIGMLAANLRDANVRSLACLGQGVVTAVEVLAFLLGGYYMYEIIVKTMDASERYLEFILQQIFLVWQLTVETEQLGLLGG